tara:strand:- start:154 stop:342 length:189 start_codon:yes stop_codon:yes gene_type:complete
MMSGAEAHHSHFPLELNVTLSGTDKGALDDTTKHVEEEALLDGVRILFSTLVQVGCLSTIAL